MGTAKTTDDWKPHPRFSGVFFKALVSREMNSGLTVNLVRVAPGSEITPHLHNESTETFYIISGRGTSWVGEEKLELAPGVCGCAPPGVTHSVRNSGQVDLEAISIFNPPQ